MSWHKPNPMIIPKAELKPPQTTYITDPVYRKHGIPYVSIIGKLAPLKVVVLKKPKCKRKKRRTQRQLPVNQSEATMAYVRAVRETFSDRPEVFEEFVRIMGEINRPGSNLLQLINRVVVLFDGHPDLIYSFDAFLPQGYELELQDDAVVVKVFEEGEADPLEDQYVIPAGAETARGPGTARSRKENIDESMEFIRGVKKAFPLRSDVYRRFMEILRAFHMHTFGELDTIKEVIKIFHGHPNLVLGFNEFLSKGFNIHMYDTKKYTVEYRDEYGAAVTTTINAY